MFLEQLKIIAASIGLALGALMLTGLMIAIWKVLFPGPLRRGWRGGKGYGLMSDSLKIEFGRYYLVRLGAAWNNQPVPDSRLGLARVVRLESRGSGWFICDTLALDDDLGQGVIHEARYHRDHIIRLASGREVKDWRRTYKVSFKPPTKARVGEYFLGCFSGAPMLFRVTEVFSAGHFWCRPRRVRGDLIWLHLRQTSGRNDYLADQICSLSDLTRRVSSEEAVAIASKVGVTSF